VHSIQCDQIGRKIRIWKKFTLHKNDFILIPFVMSSLKWVTYGGEFSNTYINRAQSTLIFCLFRIFPIWSHWFDVKIGFLSMKRLLALWPNLLLTKCRLPFTVMLPPGKVTWLSDFSTIGWFFYFGFENLKSRPNFWATFYPTVKVTNAIILAKIGWDKNFGDLLIISSGHPTARDQC
jgi:hypothetical protein